jgi:hypothetical protein
MSDAYTTGTGAQQGSSSNTDLVTTLQGIIRQITAGNTQLATLTAAILSVFPRITGSFTLAAAATTVVAQTGVNATSKILLSPTNAAAATLMGSTKSLYISAKTVGASFTVATASGVAAAGTETFDYVIVNPS